MGERELESAKGEVNKDRVGVEVLTPVVMKRPS